MLGGVCILNRPLKERLLKMASRAIEYPSPLERTFPSLPNEHGKWQRWLVMGVSLALLLAIALRLRTFGIEEALSALPRTPAFWITFAAYYLALPGSEWVIFHRLWKIPAKGLVALTRKLVSNEILLGYSGEVYFYTWARRHAALAAAPFGAIKDVSILSALAGNVFTLAMCGLAWPFLGTLAPSIPGRAVLESAVIILSLSVVTLFFRNRLFSLEARQLRAIFGIHVARLVTTTFLAGLLWHFALPETPLAMLLLLATLQLLVTRLPFIPSKDLVFANLAVVLVGNGGSLPVAITMIASALIVTHLLLGSVFLLPDFFSKEKP